MLVNCPKCGFSQPNDQYCAQCGVDMKVFRPKPESTFTKLIQNPNFYFIIILLVLVSSWMFLEKNPVQSMWAGFKASSLGSKIVGSDNKISVAELAETVSEDDNLKGSSLTEAGLEDGLQNPPSAADPTDLNSIDAQLKAAQNKLDQVNADTVGKQTTFRFVMAEIPIGFKNQLLEMIKQESPIESDEVTIWGHINNKKTLETLRSKAKIIQESEMNQDPLVNQFELFWGKKNGPDQEREGIELALAWSPNNSPNGDPSVKAEFEVTSIFREDANINQTSSRPIHGQAEIAQGGALIMVGLIPKKATLSPDNPKDRNPEFKSDRYLEVFKSPDYLKRQSEFTFWIEFGTPSHKTP